MSGGTTGALIAIEESGGRGKGARARPAARGAARGRYGATRRVRRALQRVGVAGSQYEIGTGVDGTRRSCEFPLAPKLVSTHLV